MKPDKDIGRTVAVPNNPSQQVSSIPTSVYPAQQRLLKWCALLGVEQSGIESSNVNLFANAVNEALYTRKANNLKSILIKALGKPQTSVPKGNMDVDWWFNFVEIAQEIHSSSMQDVWANLLIKEITKPGSISLPTLKIIKSLTLNDTKAFNHICNLAATTPTDTVPMVISGFSAKPSILRVGRSFIREDIALYRFGLAYSDLLAFDALGLMYKDEIETGPIATDKRQQWQQLDRQFYLTPKRKNTSLRYYKITSAGNEIAGLLKKEPQETYFYEMKEVLKKGFDFY